MEGGYEYVYLTDEESNPLNGCMEGDVLIKIKFLPYFLLKIFYCYLAKRWQQREQIFHLIISASSYLAENITSPTSSLSLC